MNEITKHGQVDIESIAHVVEGEPWSKERFRQFVTMLTVAHHASTALYAQVIDQVKGWDSEFAKRLKDIQDAEDAAIKYASSKLEQR